MNSSPSADQIKTARANAKMTQAQAGDRISVSGRQWRKYEAGSAPMSPALWLHFCIVTGQVSPNV